MEPIESSETSAYNNTLTPGTYPKEKGLQSKHGESLKSSTILYCSHTFIYKTSHFTILDYHFICFNYDRRLRHDVLTHFNNTTQETTDGSTVNTYLSNTKEFITIYQLILQHCLCALQCGLYQWL